MAVAVLDADDELDKVDTVDASEMLSPSSLMCSGNGAEEMLVEHGVVTLGSKACTEEHGGMDLVGLGDAG